ncbi:helix-turn-helix transcriptional regulator [Escherichia coli]|nr:helix-turn-helix transcriptional regulator [Escherichia coli]
MLLVDTINSILKYIDAHLEHELITINSLASYSGYSRRYLQLLFRRYVGIPVGTYIQLRRVTESAAYLRLTHRTLSDVAGRLCYDSQQTFNREFKKHTGYTPKLYRDMRIWNFTKQTGYRRTETVFSRPDLVHLPAMNITGESFSYKIDIPLINGRNDVKWGYVRQGLSDEGSVYLLLNDIHPSGIKAVVDVFVMRDNSRENIELSECLYACFSFQGKFDDYDSYVYNVNVNGLAHHGFQRLPAIRDFEIIQKKNSDTYFFDYFIPVCKLR